MSRAQDPAGGLNTALNSLVPYVKQTIPASVPDKGQPPLLPRPVYRAYDIGVHFQEGANYVELMYRLAYRDLSMALFDNNNRPVRDHVGRLLSVENRWGQTEIDQATASSRLWISVLRDSDCVPEELAPIPFNHP